MKPYQGLRCVIALLVCTLCACSDDGGSEPAPQPDMPSAAAPDQSTSPPPPPADMSTPKEDMAIVECSDPNPPSCKATSRQIGCNCVPLTDRSCEADRHCRPGETCQQVDEYKICIFEPPALRVCPGPGCESAPGGLEVGAASVSISPRGFETVKPEGLNGAKLNFVPPASPELWNDCGLDGLCPGDTGYQAPDEGEGDGVFQGEWLAGFSHGRPAQYCPEELIGCERPECCVSKFVHDDIKVQIVALRHNGLTVVFAATDTVGLFFDDIEVIRRQIPAELGVDLFVMGATHNHEGPDTSGQWGPGTVAPSSTGFHPRMRKRLTENTLDGVRQAVEALEPAKARVAVLDVGTDGLAIGDSRTPYIFDDNVPVVHFRRASDDSTIATMLSFANHPEVLWSRNPYMTSDYPHFVRRYLRDGLEAVGDKPARAGLGGVVVFYVGAVGGLIYPGRGGARDRLGVEQEEETFAAADALGQQRAERVLQAYHGDVFTDLAETDLRFADRSFLVALQNRLLLAAGTLLGVIRRDLYNAVVSGLNALPGPAMARSQVTVVRLGPVTFFTAPGELFPETLVGGYPGRPRSQTPVVADLPDNNVPAVCDEQGLPVDGGTMPCIVRPDQTNPPDFSKAPEGPYVYDLAPGEFPFFIGLGQDFLGYMVPEYDYEIINFATEAPGDHYEETNSVGPTIVPIWRSELLGAFDALKDN